MRSSERHGIRPELKASQPIHVVVRAHEDVQPLRQPALFRAIRRATYVVAQHADMRIVEISIQDTHIHLLVEANNKTALAKGMQAFGVSAARQINDALFNATGVQRRGRVITDRYHANVLATPRQVRNCIAYVLNNWRHHGADRGAKQPVDFYSSAPMFAGWSEAGTGCLIEMPSRYQSLYVREPQTWLLRVGWRKGGRPISMFDVPGGKDD
ncbi:MAG: transposase [Kofleriaceae bacterium]